MYHRETVLCLANGQRKPIYQLTTGDQLLVRTKAGFVSTKLKQVVKAKRLPANAHWLHVTALSPGSPNGRAGFTVTGDHVLTTARGQVPAAELRPGDQLLSWFTQRIAPGSAVDQLITGMCVAGAGLSRLGSSSGVCMLTWTDAAHPEHAAWRAQALACLGAKAVQLTNGVRWQTVKTTELDAVYRERFTLTAPGKRMQRVVPQVELSPLALAAWLSTTALPQTAGALMIRLPSADAASAVNAKTALMRATGLADDDVLVVKDNHALGVHPAATTPVLETIAPFVHPEVGEKLLPPGLRGRWSPPVFPKTLPPLARVPRWTTVITVSAATERRTAHSRFAYSVNVRTGQPVAGGEHGVVV